MINILHIRIYTVFVCADIAKGRFVFRPSGIRFNGECMAMHLTDQSSGTLTCVISTSRRVTQGSEGIKFTALDTFYQVKYLDYIDRSGPLSNGNLKSCGLTDAAARRIFA